MASVSEAVILGFSVLVRLLLLWQGSEEWLGRRIEISTPVNQWMRGYQLAHVYSKNTTCVDYHSQVSKESLSFLFLIW